MYGINWPQFIAGTIMILTTIYYIYVLFKTKENPEFDYIFSRSSQVTLLVFVLGISTLVVMDIASKKFNILNNLLNLGALVMLVNAISVAVCKRRGK